MNAFPLFASRIEGSLGVHIKFYFDRTCQRLPCVRHDKFSSFVGPLLEKLHHNSPWALAPSPSAPNTPPNKARALTAHEPAKHARYVDISLVKVIASLKSFKNGTLALSLQKFWICVWAKMQVPKLAILSSSLDHGGR